MSNEVTFNAATFLEGFHFECACGELYRTVRDAACCRKCRNYTWAGYCTHVIDTRTNEVVHGRIPTEEEDRAAQAACEARRVEEKAELEALEAQWEADRLEDLRLAQEAEVDAWFDRMWAIQDHLMAR